MPWYSLSVLAALWVSETASFAVSASSPAVTVTVWAVPQVVGVKGQAGRRQGHVRARVPGDRHGDSRRGLAVEDHRVAVPGRVLLGHRQRRLRHRDARQRRRRRAGACLLAAQDVDEAHLHLDLLAPLVGGQGVGGVGRVGDVLLVRRAVGVHPHPLVGEHVVQLVFIHDAVRQGRQLCTHLDRAGNDRVTRRRMVRRQAQPQRALDAGRPGGVNVPPIASKL